MLTIRNLTVSYKNRLALEGLDLEIKPGEIMGLIGPNGAGKSTLIRAISGVIPVQEGEIRWLGKDLIRLGARARARLVAVVPQAEHQGGAFSVQQTILLGRTAYMSWLGHPSKADQTAASQAMERTGLQSLAERHNAELSGGEQQRVLLARALAQQTPVLLLDEPTNHLDLQHQLSFLRLVRELADEQNLAVLMAIHDLNQVAQYADRAALLDQGRLVNLGTPGEVLTPETIQAVYHVSVQRYPHPQSGVPLILPEINPPGSNEHSK
jgi:iron complex transport system ATP-binding protein